MQNLMYPVLTDLIIYPLTHQISPPTIQYPVYIPYPENSWWCRLTVVG